MKMLLLLLAAVLLFLFQRFLYLKFWKKSLSVNLNFSDEKTVEGEELELIETLINKKILPLPIVRIKFIAPKYFSFQDLNNSKITDQYYRNDILSVTKFQKLTRSLSFHSTHRGYFSITNMDVVCSDLFVTSRSVANYPLDIHLYVYPKLVETDLFHIQFRKMMGQVLTKRYINEDPFEFRNIREYQPYDELKLINWKASAKTDSLKVNVKDYTASQQVKILINFDSDLSRTYEDVQEESIRIAATFASAFIDQGIPVSVFSNASDTITKEIVSVPAGCGSNHMNALLQSLARMDMSLPLPSFVPVMDKELDSVNDNDFILVISSYQRQDLQAELSALLCRHIDFAWIIPYNYAGKLSVNEELNSYAVPWKL